MPSIVHIFAGGKRKREQGLIASSNHISGATSSCKNEKKEDERGGGREFLQDVAVDTHRRPPSPTACSSSSSFSTTSNIPPPAAKPAPRLTVPENIKEVKCNYHSDDDNDCYEETTRHTNQAAGYGLSAGVGAPVSGTVKKYMKKDASYYSHQHHSITTPENGHFYNPMPSSPRSSGTARRAVASEMTLGIPDMKHHQQEEEQKKGKEYLSSDEEDSSLDGDIFNLMSSSHRSSSTARRAVTSERTLGIPDMKHHQQEEEKKKGKEYLSSDEEDSSLDGENHVFGTDKNEIDYVNDTTNAFHNVGGPMKEVHLSSGKDDSSYEDFGDGKSTNTVSTTNVRREKDASIQPKPACRTPRINNFEERYNQLLQFKEEFGHCNVPHKYSRNLLLGVWCNNTRKTYNRARKGMPIPYKISQDKIDRLNKIDFQWNPAVYDGTFDKRCFELETFKEEFGHCNVPRRYQGNPSLGAWCNTMRTAYKKIQSGMETSYNISQDRVEILEGIGFRWTALGVNEVFENRCQELVAFKDKFGHCNVPQDYQGNPSLGQWCYTTRKTYSRIQVGMHPTQRLPKDGIERLEEIGFQWQVPEPEGGFETRYRELIAFKEEFGHCNVPLRCQDYPSLRTWCREMKKAYLYYDIRKGIQITTCNLSQSRIERLEEIGLTLKTADYDGVFEKRYRELEAFKVEFGHCNVPQKFPNNLPLGRWCSAMKNTYNRIQKGQKIDRRFSQDRIKRLGEIGFQWHVAERGDTFEKRCCELIAFKEEFGHCNVPQKHPGLGYWCSRMRARYKNIKHGTKPDRSFTQARIERLEEIGLRWQVPKCDEAFEKRCRELIAFKEEFGNCNVPQNYPPNSSLGTWCSTMRTSYKIQKGMTSNCFLSKVKIERLEEIAFQWELPVATQIQGRTVVEG